MNVGSLKKLKFQKEYVCDEIADDAGNEMTKNALIWYKMK